MTFTTFNFEIGAIVAHTGVLVSDKNLFKAGNVTDFALFLQLWLLLRVLL